MVFGAGSSRARHTQRLIHKPSDHGFQCGFAAAAAGGAADGFALFGFVLLGFPDGELLGSGAAGAAVGGAAQFQRQGDERFFAAG